MQTINWKGHGAMFGANAIWGLMSPVAKFVMLGGIVTPLAVTDLRIVGAMILFWILSFFRSPNTYRRKTWPNSSVHRCWAWSSTRAASSWAWA